jgi:hypothetical protein
VVFVKVFALVGGNEVFAGGVGVYGLDIFCDVMNYDFFISGCIFS